MDPWFNPSNWGSAFTFSPLPAGDALLSEEQAIEVADRGYYIQRWPDVQIVAQYGLFDDGGRGTSLILPPDFPKPPYPPGGWDSLSPRERHVWSLQREEWRRDAERAGEIITHRNRLVWLVAFIGFEEPAFPAEEKAVRVKVIDTVTRRALGGYQSPLSSVIE